MLKPKVAEVMFILAPQYEQGCIKDRVSASLIPSPRLDQTHLARLERQRFVSRRREAHVGMSIQSNAIASWHPAVPASSGDSEVGVGDVVLRGEGIVEGDEGSVARAVARDLADHVVHFEVAVLEKSGGDGGSALAAEKWPVRRGEAGEK